MHAVIICSNFNNNRVRISYGRLDVYSIYPVLVSKAIAEQINFRIFYFSGIFPELFRKNSEILLFRKSYNPSHNTTWTASHGFFL